MSKNKLLSVPHQLQNWIIIFFNKLRESHKTNFFLNIHIKSYEFPDMRRKTSDKKK